MELKKTLKSLLFATALTTSSLHAAQWTKTEEQRRDQTWTQVNKWLGDQQKEFYASSLLKLQRFEEKLAKTDEPLSSTQRHTLEKSLLYELKGYYMSDIPQLIRKKQMQIHDLPPKTSGKEIDRLSKNIQALKQLEIEYKWLVETIVAKIEENKKVKLTY